MCSISGIIRSLDSMSRLIGGDSELRNSNSDVLRAAMVRMNRALRHRGPDDDGIAYVELRADPDERTGGLKRVACNSKSELLQVYLGNTRLAIIDPTSAGHQPMYDPETGLVTTERPTTSVNCDERLAMILDRGVQTPTRKLSYAHTANGGLAHLRSYVACLRWRSGMPVKRS